MANINNEQANTLISGTADADQITNEANNVTIDASDGDNTVYSGGSNVSIRVGDGNNSVHSEWGDGLTIDAGDGDDTIYSRSSDAKITSGAGNDSIYNWVALGVSTTVDAGDGNDTIDSIGSKATINGGEGDDSIANRSGSNSTINSGAGNDTIFNDSYTEEVTVNTGDGDDQIFNYGDRASIDGGAGNDTIRNTGANVTIDGGDDDDSIANESANVLIDAGSGNNFVSNTASNVTINGGNGNDTIVNTASNVTINISGGRNSVVGSGDSVLITISSSALSGAGVNNDYVRFHGNHSTIMTGAGIDTIVFEDGDYDALVDAGEGNDVVSNIRSNATIAGGSGYDTLSIDSNASLVTFTDFTADDVIAFNQTIIEHSFVSIVGASDFTLKSNALELIFENQTLENVLNAIVDNNGTLITFADLIVGEHPDVHVDLSSASGIGVFVIDGGNISIDGGVYSTKFKASVESANGDILIGSVTSDHVYEAASTTGLQQIYVGGSNWSVVGTGNADSLEIIDASNSTISAGDGDDSIHIDANGGFDHNLVDGGAGADSIVSNEDSSTILGGEDNDSIVSNGSNVTIDGGANDDAISLGGSNNVIKYAAGGGNDTVFGFDESSDSFQPASGLNFEFIRVGSDMIVSVIGSASGSITFKDVVNAGTVETANANVTLTSSIGLGYFVVGKASVTGSDAFYDAGFKTLPGFNDVVVGTVTSDHVYEASSSTGLQRIEIGDDDWSVIGSSNADTINNTGDSVTIEGGAGDDAISLGSDADSIVIDYSDGGGNDTLYGFSSDTTTLRIADGLSTFSVRSGTDIIVNVEGTSSGSLTLKNMFANAVETVNAGIRLSDETSSTGVFIVDSNAVDSADAFYDASLTTESPGIADLVVGSITGELVYEASSSTGKQQITIGGNNWSIAATALDDSIVVNADDATIKAGSGADTISIASDVTMIAFNDLASEDRISFGQSIAEGSLVSLENASGVTLRSSQRALVFDGKTLSEIANYTVDNNGTSNTIGELLRTVPANPDVTVELTEEISTTGVFVLDLLASSLDADYFASTFKTSAENGDLVVGSVNSAHVYEASSTTVRQRINITSSNWDVTATDKDDSIGTSVSGEYITIRGGGGNDYIENQSPHTTIFGGAGDDSIINAEHLTNVLMMGETGNDFIKPLGDGGVTMIGGADDDVLDLIDSSAEPNLIVYNVGDGNDTVHAYLYNDVVSIDSNLSTATLVSGDDMLVTIGTDGSILFTNAAPQSTIVGTEANVNLGLAVSDTGVFVVTTIASLAAFDADAKFKSTLESGDTLVGRVTDRVYVADNDSLIQNITVDGAWIVTATGLDDRIVVNGDDASIDGGAGADSISIASSVRSIAFNNLDSDDFISVENKIAVRSLASDGSKIYSDAISIEGLGEAQTIDNAGESIAVHQLIDNPIEVNLNSTVDGAYVIDALSTSDAASRNSSLGANDLVFGSMSGGSYSASLDVRQHITVGSALDVSASTRDDSIVVNVDGASISGGAGNDLISLDAADNVIRYAAGDGNDTVYGFSSDTTRLQIASGLSTSSVRSGTDMIVNVSGASVGSITLVDVLGASIIENANAAVTLASGLDTGCFVIDQTAIGDPYDFYAASLIASPSATDLVVGSVTADHAYVATDGARQYININDDGWSVTASDGDDTVNNWGGDSIFIDAGAGVDSIESGTDHSTLLGGAGRDSIRNHGMLTLIDGGADNDTIACYIKNDDTDGSSSSYTTILGGDGNDHIDNHGHHASIEGGDGDDTLYNYVGDDYGAHLEYEAHYSTIRGGNGNDYIDNHGHHALVEGGDGDDTLCNYNGAYFEDEAHYSTLLGGSGNDTIRNSGSYATINAGDGNDTIYSSGDDVTINADVGDDVINLIYGFARIEYNDGDGDDTVYGFSNETATLAFADGLSTSSMQSGNDVIISVEGASVGTITLKDFVADIVTVRNANANVNLSSYDDSSGYFVVDGSSVEDTDAFYTASFTTSTVGTDIIVGSVTADHAYVATDGARQYININDDGWSVTAGDGNDSIDNYGLNATINAGSGNDVIDNFYGGDYATINAGAGNDSIDNGDVNVTINAGDGNDTITNTGLYASINAGSGNDVIDNSYGGDYATINAGDGNDYIHNDGLYATINAGEGDDSIINHGDHASINAGDGNDSIHNDVLYATINAGEGDDSIINHGDHASINAGEGDDFISNNGRDATINADVGDDVISINGGSARLEYNDGDGHDTIYGFSNETATLAFADGLSTSSMQSGNDVIITVEGASVGTITLVDYVSTVNAEVNLDEAGDSIGVFVVDGASIGDNDAFLDATFKTSDQTLATDLIVGDVIGVRNYSARDIGRQRIRSTVDEWNIIDASDGDSIANYGAHSTLDAGAGNDFIINGALLNDDGTVLKSGSLTALDAGAGDDRILNVVEGVTISGGAGDDSVLNRGVDDLIDGGAGADSIINAGVNVTINGGADNDLISLGADVDTVTLDSGSTLTIGTVSDSVSIEYKDGDGDDTIYGFSTERATIRFADGLSISSVWSGNDLILGATGASVGSITLVDYVSSVNAEVNLDEAGDLIGAFVVDMTSNSEGFFDTTFKPSIESGDLVAGSITGARVYEASSSTGRQRITVSSDWRVEATGNDDSIVINGDGSTINGAEGADSISIATNVSMIAFADLEADDLIRFADKIAEKSLVPTESDSGVKLSSSQIEISFGGKTLAEIKEYAVDNAGTPNTIEELLAGTGTIVANASLTLNDETSSTGVFVVDGNSIDSTDTFCAATFKTSTLGTDIVVGSVSSDKVYSARSDVGRQAITVESDWSVRASELDDSIDVLGDGSTIDGGAGSDSISIASSVRSITFDNFDSDDFISLGNKIAARSFAASEDDKGATLTADGFELIIDKELAEIENYVIDNGGESIAVHQLIDNPIEINLSSTSDGVYALDALSTSDRATLTASAGASDLVFGTVSSGAYTASPDARQHITVGSALNVSASARDDSIVVNANGATIDGADGADTISIASSVETITFSDLDADDLISFANKISARSLTPSENASGATLTSDRYKIIFGGRTLEELESYAVDNAGETVSLGSLFADKTRAPGSSIDLSTSTDTGVFVVDGYDRTSSMRNASLKSAAAYTDLIVGSIVADGEYIAASVSGGQHLNVVDGWLVTATDFDDSIDIGGDSVTLRALDGNDTIVVGGAGELIDAGAGDDLIMLASASNYELDEGTLADAADELISTIIGGDGADTIVIDGSVSKIIFNDFSSDDFISFGNKITVRSLVPTESDSGVKLSSSQIEMNFVGKELAEIEGYAVDNGGETISIHQLIYNPIEVNLSSTLDGAYVLDGASTSDLASRVDSIGASDLIVGSVSSGNYSASLDVQQNITVGGALNVSATSLDDLIVVNADGATIDGGSGADLISIASNVSTIAFDNLDSDDFISVGNKITARSLAASEDGKGATLSSDRIEVNFGGKTIAEIENHVIDNGGEEIAIHQLIDNPIEIDLSSTLDGAYVLDARSTLDAASRVDSVGASDLIVGSISSGSYAASLDARQHITVGGALNVSASARDDSIVVNANGSTINGAEGADTISIASSARSITFADLSSDDLISLGNKIAAQSLMPFEDSKGVTLSADGFEMIFSGKKLAEIKNYAVDNGGTRNTINDLLRVRLTNPDAEINLSEAFSTGVFVVDAYASLPSDRDFHLAEFKTADEIDEEDDIIVGSVTSALVYEASSSTGRQLINATNDYWSIGGSTRADTIAVDALVSTITFTDIDSDDFISVENKIDARSLASLESDDGVTLSSDRIEMSFVGKTLSAIERYAVGNAGTDTSIYQLIENPIGVNLSNVLNRTGAFSLNPTSTRRDASFDASDQTSGIIVGRVGSSKTYVAEGDSPVQAITVASDWDVTATEFDDTIAVNGSNATVEGGDGSDSISIGSSARSITFNGLDSDDFISFGNKITERSLVPTESESGVKLSSSQIEMSFVDQTLDEIKDYTVENGGESNTIEELLKVRIENPIAGIDLSTVEANSTGIFVVDAYSDLADDALYYLASLKPDAEVNDITVGEIVSDRNYSARSSSGRQYINASEGWSVEATELDDFIYVSGSNATIEGAGGSDTLAIDAAVSTITFNDLSSDDVISFGNKIAERSLASLENENGVTLSSDRIEMIFNGSSLSEIKNYAVDNGGESSTIADLIATVDAAIDPDEIFRPIDTGTVVVNPETTYRVQLSSLSYGFEPTGDYGDPPTNNYILLLTGSVSTSTVLTADEENADASIWLNGRGGRDYSGAIKVLDASHFYGQATLVGNDMSNIITASARESSLWGGEGSENDTLIGANGRDEFFYLKGNGLDVINRAESDDVINLLNIGLDDLDLNFETLRNGISTNSIELRFNDGGSIRVNSSADVTFKIADGSSWHAVDRDSSNRRWEAK